MAITLSRQPDLIAPVFSDRNKFIMSEAGATHFTLVFSGDVTGTFKIYPNSLGIAEFNARYLLENYIYSQIALPNVSPLPNGLKTYSVSITSSLATVLNVAGLQFFNGALQDRESRVFLSGDILNNANDGIYIHRSDEVTLQMISGSTIIVINAGTVAQSIPSNVYDYVVAGVAIHIVKEHPKFEPYRFAYVNQNGGTDYVNFSLADAENLGIKRDYFENDNKEILYNVEVDQEFTCFSDSMTEEQSKNLRYFWISPKIELIRNGIHYPVNIQTKSQEIKNRESGLIFYNVTFMHESKFNVQK